MTHVTCSKVLATLFAGFFVLAASSASATALLTLPDAAKPSSLKTDSAEFCTATDGRLEIIRDFGSDQSFVVIASPDGSSRPMIRSGFTYAKQPGGTTLRNEVDFAMFELMVEPFDNEPKDQRQWAKTFEEVFTGNVAIIDEKGKTVGVIRATCHAAVVDFK